ncbi:NAD(P)/FAD-dependent oxidoreductase [Piscinibacter sakaiensis]|uniref:NAD(P)/FAD-dependent oxidoreductase n=1 Tax=Piscinibacter sakaiensis TaxID=1547922 RepID=UPI003AAB433D
MPREIVVLGAGIVGISAALHLVKRGHSVTVFDRRAPGRETSYGNAGIIQREAVEPYAFPRQWRAIVDVVLKRGIDVDYHLSALLAAAPRLWAYRRWSAPDRYPAVAAAYSTLIAHSVSEHAALIDEAGAGALVERRGFRQVFRNQAPLDTAAKQAERMQTTYGVRHQLQDGDALARAEPALRRRLAGAIHWLDPWCVRDPGGLVAAYAELLTRLGGRIVGAEVRSLQRAGAGWRVVTANHGTVEAGDVVVALGPWSDALLRPLGYHLPLFVKRGYHRHYSGGERPTVPIHDTQNGYVLVPTVHGVRLTTGAEFAAVGARPTPRQLQRAEPVARELLELPTPVEAEPWHGWRPCTVDMKPVIGASREPGLWFDFGHGHQGFTLGPASGRLLADLVDGETPFVDAAPFSPARF